VEAAETARKVYDEAIVIDGLNVSLWSSPNVYPSLSLGGVTAINATMAIWEGFRETLDRLAGWSGRFREHADTLSQGRTADDILQAKADGKTAVFLGWQNASPIENDLDRLLLFYDLGVRVIQITYNERNLLGNGCYERIDDGLSNFGLDAVKIMNELGILVDLSHVGDTTTMETIEASDKPVAFTHCNARSFVDHVRNKPDDALKALVEKGGVVGANAWPSFLLKGYESDLADYADAIEDLVERVGIDHVGIGTDFCQDQPYSFFQYLFAQQGTKIRPIPLPIPDPHYHPHGFEGPDQMPDLAGELMGRGFSKDDTGKVLGGNFLRLFREVMG